jgi:hypothetical protein
MTISAEAPLVGLTGSQEGEPPGDKMTMITRAVTAQYERIGTALIENAGKIEFMQTQFKLLGLEIASLESANKLLAAELKLAMKDFDLAALELRIATRQRKMEEKK